MSDSWGLAVPVDHLERFLMSTSTYKPHLYLIKLTCWSSSLLRSIQTDRLLMHGNTTVLPSNTTYTTFCPSQKRCSLRALGENESRGRCQSRHECSTDYLLTDTYEIWWHSAGFWRSLAGGSRDDGDYKSTNLCHSVLYLSLEKERIK